ncbi:hypothetical protein WL56_26665 [Burkholderia cepacia]|nr:hypothetical protein WL56_26665 [Burkholderia cepacia]
MQHSLEETFGGSFITPLLQQDVEFGTMLVDGAPQHIRLAAQSHEHLVEVPGAAGLASYSLRAAREDCTEFVAPATDGFVADDDTAFEQQFLNVAQTELEPEVPSDCQADDRSWETMAVVKRLGIRHSGILRDHPP